jgi:hypothetical protein
MLIMNPEKQMVGNFLYKQYSYETLLKLTYISSVDARVPMDCL